jgi:hypothetical protein
LHGFERGVNAYHRVSTGKQRKSGLGIEAVAAYLNGGYWRIIAEFTEIESGRSGQTLGARTTPQPSMRPR